MNCHALAKLLLVISAVYPHLVEQTFQYKSWFTQLKTFKTKLFRGSPEFPNQNLRQIGQGFMSYDRTNKQSNKYTNKDYYFIYINNKPDLLE